MAFISSLIDIVRNGTVIQQKINAEQDATDPTRIAPARVIQFNGNPLADNNALPTKLSSSADLGAVNDTVATTDTGAFSIVALFKRLLTKLPSLVGGRIPVDNSGVVQPISGTVSVSNFPASSGGGSSGTQYQDGVTQATPTGNVVLANNAGVLKALQLDTTNRLMIASSDLGTINDIAAGTDVGAFTLISAVKRLLARFTMFLTTLGAIADVSDTTGSLMARLRAGLDRIGSFGDAANPNGSIMAQLRYVGESLNRLPITTPINETTAGDRTIIAATASKQIAISSLFFTVSAGASVTLKNGASTAISGPMQIAEHAGDYEKPIVLSTNTAFIINVSAVANVRGYVIWYLV